LSNITPLDKRPRSGPYAGLNVNSAKRFLTKQFKQAGLETADIDARLLVMKATGYNRAELVLNGTEFLSQEAFSQISNFAARRLSGEPVDHILGVRGFYGRDFKVSKDVLSPRPDTELLIDKALPFLKPLSAPKILDLGTGSGAIILTLLAECETAIGEAADISETALKIAQDNTKRLGLGGRLSLIKSNWFTNVNGPYDVIISNPPYIDAHAMEKLSPEVKHYDPEIALFGGEDGLAPYRIIAEQAPLFLAPHGLLILEIGFDQGRRVSEILRIIGWQNISVFKDLNGQDRCITASL